MAIVYPTKTLTARYRRKADGVLATPSSPLVMHRKLNTTGAGTALTLASGLTEQSPGVLTATVSGDPAKYHAIAGSSSQGDQVTPAELTYDVPQPQYPSNQ